MPEYIDSTTSIYHNIPQDIDIFSVYTNCAKTLGDDHVFLLESSAGPDVDCKESILGVGKLANIEFYHNRIEIIAPELLRKALETKINVWLGDARISNGIGQMYSGEDVWGCIREINNSFSPQANQSGAFNFGFLICLGYDAASLIEKLPYKIQEDEYPLITLQLFQSVLRVSKSGEACVSVTRSKLFPEPPIDLTHEFFNPDNANDDGSPPPEAEISFSISKEEYLPKIERALEHIRQGDIYQVQVGHEICVKSSLSPAAAYKRLRALNPSPYMFLCHVASFQLIGASPESYIRLDQQKISMRPIAGTIGKAAFSEHQELVQELTSSSKERAEHTMLVDLCRNDIARVARANTLNVDTLMAVEEFSHLFHLVSTVTGEIAHDHDIVDLIKATFPAGTMTGAPKIRAMEIIEDLEVSRRRAYAGAIGLIGPGNYANLALCIRMASFKDGIYSLRASAGVVADSTPENEWRETLVKMGAVYRALTGKELAQ